MNRFDQAARYGVKINAGGQLAWLLRRTAALVRFRNWLDTRGIVFPGEKDRTNDTVAWLGDADPAREWAIPIEFTLKPDGDMFGRLLSYLGAIRQEKRPTDVGKEYFSVGALVVNLTGVGHTSQEMGLEGTDLSLKLNVGERNLETEDAAATLAQIAHGELARCVLVWIPLMRGADERAIIDEWKRLAMQEPDARLRGDYAGLALVFAEAAKRWELWKNALKGWNMVESQQVLEWMAEGEAKGLKDGEAKGRKDGEARGKRDSLLLLLQKRFGAIDKGLSDVIRAMADLERLNDWFTLAIEAESLEAFRAVAGM